MDIKSIVMPKWGLSMEEGILAKWLVSEGQPVSRGQEIAEIETTKIANSFESPVDGLLRRFVASEGQTFPVGALIGVVAPADVSDEQIEQFVVDFQKDFEIAGAAVDGGPEPKTIDIGRKLRVLSVGSGDKTPVVLIHGFGSDLSSWLFNQEALSDGRVVHSLDLPGHGASDKNVGDGSVQELSLSVLMAMDHLGIGRAHLIGHSLGGAIAAQIAARHADRAASVTLIAPAGLGPEVSGAFLDGFIAESRPRKLRPVLEMLVASPELITGDMIEDVLKFKRLDGAEAALKCVASKNFPGGVQANRLADVLARSSVPILAIVGKDDQIIPARHVDALSPHAKIVSLKGAGHLPHMEKSAEVNDAIKAFIDGVPV